MVFQNLESKQDSVVPLYKFILRVGMHFAVTLAIVNFSMIIGMLGYHYWGELDWLDSAYNAAMILTGMGPVNPMTTVEGKLFGMFYALFSGIVFLTLVVILMTPIYHRFMHQFHFNTEDIE